MTGIIKSLISYAPLVVCGAFMTCSNGNRLAGAGSETTNGIMIAGKLYNADESPAPGAVVKLFHCDYDAVADSEPPIPFTDTTDSLGRFRFCRVDSGLYNVLARNDSAGTGVLLGGIIVKNDDSLITAPSGNLHKTGSILVDLSEAPDMTVQYVFIPGTDLSFLVKENNRVIIDKVPAGIIPVLSYATKTRNVYSLRYTIPVKSEDTTTLRNPAWRYDRGIVFNTSSSGAGVVTDVYDFPALIRLTGENFDFQEARPDGRDIRFARSDGPFLPFEIERWDATSGLAEIWVKIDTVFGNSAGQTIMMYWGNDQAAAASDAGAVFDTAQGFQGVWHFNELLADSVRDATDNRFNGVASGMHEASITEGMIGKCREFDGAASCIIMPNTADGKLSFAQNGKYTLSAWVLVDTLDSASHMVVSKGIFQYYLWYTYVYQDKPNWEFVKYVGSPGWNCSIFPVTAKQWVLLTAVCTGTSQYLYVNGELGDTTLVKYAPTDQPTAPTDLIIGRYFQSVPYPGRYGGYCYFDGKIDEIRICNRSRTVEWIRLCYMNQNSNDKLVTLK